MVVIEFPDVTRADESGLLAISGEVDPDYLLAAYRQGIFPWPIEEERLLWFAPPRRGILMFDEFHAPRRTLRELKSKRFEARRDTAFERVINLCANVERRGQDGTWITPKLIDAFIQFHHMGYAQSFETWDADGNLVGGLYGTRINNFFAGESMFNLASGASKFALINAVASLKAEGLTWMDIQVLSPLLNHFGAREVSRARFSRMLSLAIEPASR